MRTTRKYLPLRCAVTPEQIALAEHYYRVRAMHPLPGCKVAPPVNGEEFDVLEDL